MKCDRCGKQVKSRFFIPIKNPVRRILNSSTQNLREGEWICRECLQKEKMKVTP